MPPVPDRNSSEITPLISTAVEIENDVLASRFDDDDSSSTDLSLVGRIWNELQEQFNTAFPTVQSLILAQIPWMISLRFAGDLGSEELAAAALASTLCNVTGLSLSVGLSSALTTLAGQARGDLMARLATSKGIKLTTASHKDLEHPSSFETSTEKRTASTNNPLPPLIYLYRGLFLQLLFVVPVGCWWIAGVESTLLALGQGPLVSQMTAQYLRVLTPGLWAFSINWTYTAWLQAMELATIPAWSATLAFSLHVPFNLFFIHVLGWGYLGVAYATVCFNCVQPLFTLTYLYGTSQGREQALKHMAASAIGRYKLSFWLEARLAITSLQGQLQYLNLAIPGILIVSEWWASEVTIFMSGRLGNGDVALGGMSIYQSINSFIFMFSMAIGVAASTRVGNLLGAGDAQGASFSAKVSVGWAALTSICLGCALYSIPHTFLPSLFAPNEHDVILETSRTIPLLAIYAVADSVQVVLNGIIKGCGRQCITVPIVVVAYWLVGVPLAW
jgi:MATE family multidrug resistance protein